MVATYGVNKVFEEFFWQTEQYFCRQEVCSTSPERILRKSISRQGQGTLDNPGVQIYDPQVQDSHGVFTMWFSISPLFCDTQGKVLGL